MASGPREMFRIGEREVAITNPDKVFFPKTGYTKRDLVLYYLAVAEGAMRGVRGRPMLLKRYPDGVEAEPFFQKRVPESRPAWLETATMAFPSGRYADLVVLREAAGLAWVVNLGCVDLNPHPLRAEDMEHPDELRVDLDPVPGVTFRELVDVANVAREVLADMGLVGWPKTSGSRGIHVFVRIAPRWPFDDVRRAAQALAREVARRAPAIATATWRKEERHGVFVDYNQNARDRTTASAYSVRPTPDARVSMPLAWDDLATCDPADFTLATVPAIVRERGDAHAGIDEAVGSLDRLLALADALGAAPKTRARMPLVVVAKARKKEDALAGLERWRARHPKAAAHLAVDDVIVDAMRGRFTTWTRVRVNLRHVPDRDRPPAEPPDPDDAS